MNLNFATCSWNYPSWVGLVYSTTRPTAAEYLKEYSQKYNTVEIDSWFYKIPNESEVEKYIENVTADFTFTCKAPQKITQVRDFNTKELNKDFLSVNLFNEFHKRVEAMKGKMALLMLEFEYMNKEKMSGVKDFILKLEKFIKNIPRDIPIGIECRNENYLNEEYFSFLKGNNLVHVFSEKIYMPPIVELFAQWKNLLTDFIVVRLLGGDRKQIELKINNQWNKIVAPKDTSKISEMLREMLNNGKQITVNVNNHYEGSAPLTIERMKKEISKG